MNALLLMLGCLRPGSLSPNLQGLWNSSSNPPWRCDYHSDVNAQMNYWFADPAALPECFRPLAGWHFSIREVLQEETRTALGKPGFAMRVENGIFGGGSYRWSTGDASWVANNLWDHHRLGPAQRFRRNLRNPRHRSRSPRQVHRHARPTARPPYREMRPAPGKMERVDRDDPKNQHRDLSHLIALHPVTITRDGTGIEARTLDHGHLHFPTEGGASYRITPC